MLDEEEIQRRELSRLLSTAKDKDRQELILKALHALDEQEKVADNGTVRSHYHGMSPSIHANLLLGENMPVLESMTVTPGGSSRMRPMSARRRPSVPNLLDAIPETAPRSVLANRNEEIVLPAEDIAEVVASCYDRRFPPKNIFRHGGAHRSSEFNSIASAQAQEHHGFGYGGSSSSGAGGYSALTSDAHSSNSSSAHHSSHHSGHHGGALSASNSANSLTSPAVVVPVAQRRLAGGGTGAGSVGTTGTGPGAGAGSGTGAGGGRDKTIKGWLCSGLVPQFLHVAFFEKWEVKKIEVFCSGIERLCVHICASASAAARAGATAVDMVHMGKGAFVWTAGGTEDTFDHNVGGVPGISVTFLIRATSSAFVHISEMRIIAHPYT